MYTEIPYLKRQMAHKNSDKYSVAYEWHSMTNTHQRVDTLFHSFTHIFLSLSLRILHLFEQFITHLHLHFKSGNLEV